MWVHIDDGPLAGDLNLEDKQQDADGTPHPVITLFHAVHKTGPFGVEIGEPVGFTPVKYLRGERDSNGTWHYKIAPS